MNEKRPSPSRRLPVWAFVLGAMVFAVGFAMTAVFGISDALPSEILAALRPVQQPVLKPDVIVIVHRPPTGVARGIQLGLLALLLGGVPAAIAARVLTGRRQGRERRWSGGWGSAFLAGFVFQLSSLMLTAFLLVLLLWLAWDHAAHAEDVLWFGGPLLLSSACSIWGLRWWRALQFQVHDTHMRVTDGPALAFGD